MSSDVDDLSAQARRQYASDILHAYGRGRAFEDGWQSDAARAIGITSQQVSNMLRGRRPVGAAMLERVRSILCAPDDGSGGLPSGRVRGATDSLRLGDLRAAVAEYGRRRGHVRGWQSDAAAAMGISKSQLSGIVNGKAGFSVERVDAAIDAIARATSQVSDDVKPIRFNASSLRQRESAAHMREVARDLLESFGKNRGFERGWRTDAASAFGLPVSTVSGMLRLKRHVGPRTVARMRSVAAAIDAHRPRI